MNKIKEIFDGWKKEGKKGLIPYLTLGYPTLESTEKFALALWESGVSLLELGIPFSDPIADGPVIQRAGEPSGQGLQIGQQRQRRFHSPLPGLCCSPSPGML